MATPRTKTLVGRAAAGITVVGLATAGLLGYQAASAGTSSDRYRTVTAAAGTVTQVLSLSGTVHHVAQASVSFPTSGKIIAVNVRAGDTVTAGQALASIDTTPLQNAVLAADATYKNAVAQYETDQSTYASSSTTTTSATKAATATTTARPTSTATGVPSGGGTGTPGGGGSTGGDAVDAAVKAAEDALAALQVGIATVDGALPTFIAQCVPLIPTGTAVPGATVTQTVTQTATVTQTVTHTATVTQTATVTVTAAPASGSVSGAAVTAKATTTTTAPATSASTSTSGTASASTTASGSTSATATASSTSALPAACQTAIDTLTASSNTLPDQMTAATLALNAAVKALNAKAAALASQASALASATAGVTNPANSLQNQASILTSTNSALQAAAAAAVGNASSRTGAGTVTEATLITDKANIEATRISLAEAQDQLSRATITSPIAGKVASIPFILGQQASATASAVIIGSGAIEVTVPVPLAKRPQVAPNQTATVTSSVGGTTLTGTISRISLLPTSTGVSLAASTGAAGAAGTSSTSSTTYATVITVPSGGDSLPEGSRVQATITTKTVDAKVVLPASAVTPTGTTSATVQVLNGSTVTVKRIVTGAVGDAYVEIVSGLNAGDTVVIADTTIPIAAASIQTGRPTATAAQQQTAAGDPAQGGGVPPAGGAAPTR